MRRIAQLTAALALGFGLLVAPLAPTVLADDDNDTSTPNQDDFGEAGQLPIVQGLIYGIKEREGAQVLTIYDLNVGNGGLGIDVYVRDPGLVALVKNGTACVGRFATAEGVRTGVTTLDAQGLVVDTTKKCGEPPK